MEMGTSPEERKLSNAIIRLIEEDKPATVEQLIRLAKGRLPNSENSITETVLRLQSEGKITLTQLSISLPFRSYIKTEHARWFWLTVITSIATAASVFTIPEEAFPWAFIRYVLGIIFVLWLPGYTLVKTLFPNTISKKASTRGTLDAVERFALSLGVSLALVPIVGLLLNYTPWGIRLAPITLSLLGLTLIFSVAALLREHQATEKTKD